MICLQIFITVIITQNSSQRDYFQKETRYLDGQIWALKADSLTSPLIVTVTVTCDLITTRINCVLVSSVMTRCSVISCVGSHTVPSMHLAPLLGLDYDPHQFDNDQQVSRINK